METKRQPIQEPSFEKEHSPVQEPQQPGYSIPEEFPEEDTPGGTPNIY